LLSETVAQLVGTETNVKRDRRIDSQPPRKQRKSKSFLSRKFFTAKRCRSDFGQQSIAHCKDSQRSSRLMAGHQARSAVFAHNVPAMTDKQQSIAAARYQRR
jgi:hypothetical protein